jgi:hypothetical protein
MKVREPSGAIMGSVRRPSVLSPSMSRKSCACIVVRMTSALQASAMIAVLSRVLVGAMRQANQMQFRWKEQNNIHRINVAPSSKEK